MSRFPFMPFSYQYPYYRNRNYYYQKMNTTKKEVQPKEEIPITSNTSTSNRNNSNNNFSFNFLPTSIGPINFNPDSLNDNEQPVFEMFNIKIYLDDIIILCLLFFLYQEDVKDEMLYISLILLLLS